MTPLPALSQLNPVPGLPRLDEELKGPQHITLRYCDVVVDQCVGGVRPPFAPAGLEEMPDGSRETHSSDRSRPRSIAAHPLRLVHRSVRVESTGW